MRTNIRPVVASISVLAALLLPRLAVGQLCGIPCPNPGCDTNVYKVEHLDRTSFNTVDALAGTQVVGYYSDNWYKYAYAEEYRGSQLLHYGHDGGYYDPIGVQWIDNPSSTGVGLYETYSYHEASCGGWDNYTYSGKSRTVNQPTIGNLPYGNALWYFGSSTPAAVPQTAVSSDPNANTTINGYFYQYANLTFNKNCGGSDSCSGTPSWDAGTSPQISVNSSGTVSSSTTGTCQNNNVVSASLGEWTINTPSLLVNSPSYLNGTGYYTESISAGWQSNQLWNIEDVCGYAVPSHAIHEQFTNWADHGSNWPFATASHVGHYNIDVGDYTFIDHIFVHGSLSPPLRANISETVLVLLINEQGEKEKGRDEREFSWFWFFWRLGWHGTERRRAWRAEAEWSGSPSGRRFGAGLAA